MTNSFCITETWLSDYVFDREILPCGFTLPRKDGQSRGGGVLIAVSSSVASCKLPSPPDVEAIAVNITLNKLQIVVCNCHIPPNSGDSYLDTLLTFLSNLIYNHD